MIYIAVSPFVYKWDWTHTALIAYFLSLRELTCPHPSGYNFNLDTTKHTYPPRSANIIDGNVFQASNHTINSPALAVHTKSEQMTPKFIPFWGLIDA